MVSAEERAAIEGSYRASASPGLGGVADSWDTAFPGPSGLGHNPGILGAAAVGTALSALATDAVFAVADIFAGGEELEEWVEIA